MSGMHEKYGSVETSSLKRFSLCFTLQNIREANIASILGSAIPNRPSSFCPLHLLQGAEEIDECSAKAIPFGWRICN